MVYLLEDG
ncbi:UNVERIFIED_CONTAM: hypothetical protein GTU68_059349 [Idotea baltica]|nr:hypothetical protein [Idotea baltica]